MLPQSVAKTGACLADRVPAEKLSFYQPNRQSKLEMVQQKVEELFYSQSDWCLIVTSWWEVIAGVPANREKPPRTNVVLKPTL